jgi:hypothetical protein
MRHEDPAPAWDQRFPRRTTVAAGPGGWEGVFTLVSSHEGEATRTAGDILRGAVDAGGAHHTPDLSPCFAEVSPGLLLKIEKQEERLDASRHTTTTRYRVRVAHEALPVLLLLQEAFTHIDPSSGTDESRGSRYSVLVEAADA